MLVSLVTVITVILVAAIPPKVTVVPGVKLVPVNVTTVPPTVDPTLGALFTKVGALGM